MDRTNTKIDLKRSQLYAPGTQPKQPGETDGEVAVAVTEDELPDVGTSATPYGLSAEQVWQIKSASRWRHSVASVRTKCSCPYNKRWNGVNRSTPSLASTQTRNLEIHTHSFLAVHHTQRSSWI